MSERLASICIFLTSGRTFTFREVSIIHDNESAITFSYTAMSDENEKTVTFYKNHVAGVARCE